ncbi:MAG: hypothetical protein AAB669_01325 [Patescibacteria group bacterium]
MDNLEHFSKVDTLHTEHLEKKYGPIHAEVLHHDTEYREALLDDESGISRTYALTFLAEQQSPEIAEIDKLIREGGAIGKTFQDFGFRVRKNVIDVYLLEANPWLQEKFKEKEGQVKARLSEFLAAKDNGRPIVYGTVMEAYTPDFRPPEINDVDRQQISAPIAWMEHAGIDRSEIWRRIGNNDDWTGLEDIIAKARAESQDWTDYYRKLVDYYLGLHA